MQKTIIQFDIETLFDGQPSDQFRETVFQVNRSLSEGSMLEQKAKELVTAARQLEIFSRYFSLPLEMGSAQTEEVESRKLDLIKQSKK